MIDGVTIEEDTEMTVDKFVSKKKKSDSYDVDLFASRVSLQGKSPQGSHYIKLKGWIGALVYIHSKEPMIHVCRLLRQDIVCSLMARVNLLLEDLAAQEEPRDLYEEKTLWKLPRRYLFPFVNPIEFCDYMFSHESTQDCIERCSAMLSVTIQESDITFTEETAQDGPLIQPVKTTPLIKTPITSTTKQEPVQQQVISQPKDSQTKILLAILSFLVVFIAYYLTK
eukprot:TRINITY_DN2333_c0_g1_i1.p1 TRINITY_DN2333_c0_g1~~TRINITY_DN2333_c0_g1_i1.p1  ORF type:complete len:225 (+),score=37.53 TRINITY_DN2333_c0_g1_i1:216-890(+)